MKYEQNPGAGDFAIDSTSISTSLSYGRLARDARARKWESKP